MVRSHCAIAKAMLQIAKFQMGVHYVTNDIDHRPQKIWLLLPQSFSVNKA